MAILEFKIQIAHFLPDVSISINYCCISAPLYEIGKNQARQGRSLPVMSYATPKVKMQEGPPAASPPPLVEERGLGMYI